MIQNKDCQIKAVCCLAIFSFLSCFVCSQAFAGEAAAKNLTVEDFIDLAVRNDSQFEKFLIDELSLAYRQDLGLPARDLVLSVKSQYDFMLNQNREEPDVTIGLTKLFPFTGTELSAQYQSVPSTSSTDNSSSLALSLAQPVLQNAFGKVTRLKDKIIGLEVDVARYQIVEAYEDYLAAIIRSYYDWYEAYENVLIGRSSYEENLKLLDNMKERQKSKIALPVDVNKIELQVLAKKEKLIDLKDKYERAFDVVKRSIRARAEDQLVPAKPHLYKVEVLSFPEAFKDFEKSSRTFSILHLLDVKSALAVDQNADDLLPSIQLTLGYEVDGKDWGIADEESMVVAGVSLEWPFPDQVDRAEYEVAKLDLRKQKVINDNTYYVLYTNIRSIYLEMSREQELIKIANKKISLAESILKDETENYSFGKITLNDYISAVNILDTNQFNKIAHEVEYNRLMLEWLRLTDQLVTKASLEQSYKR